MSENLPNQIHIIVSGICPLFLVKENDQIKEGIFGFIDDKRHVTSLKVNDAEIGMWQTGKVTLNVKKGDGSDPSITPYKNHPTYGFEHIIDLERHHIFDFPIPKDYSSLKSQFHFNHGQIFTNKLHDYDIDLIRNREVIEGPRKIATEIGVLIPLAENDEAELHFEDQNVKLTLKNSRFEIVLDNSCSGWSNRCPDSGEQNDFLLNYKVLQVAAEDRVKLRRHDPNGCGELTISAPTPRICGSLVSHFVGETRPNPDDYLKLHY